MDCRKHSFSESAEDGILTICIRTDLSKEEREKEVANIPSDGFCFLYKVQAKVTPEHEKRDGDSRIGSLRRILV